MKSPYAEMPEKMPGGITPEGWQCRHMIWDLSRREIGVSVPELGPGKLKIAESGIRRMLTLGQIFIGRPNGQTRGRGVRYFASKQDAKNLFSKARAGCGGETRDQASQAGRTKGHSGRASSHAW